MANAIRDALGSAGNALAHLEVVPSPELRREAVASFALWPWVALCGQRNLPIESVAQLAHVSVAELRDPGVRFSQTVGNRVAELAFQHAGGGAAMEAARLVEPGHFTLIELLARTAPNVTEAMKLVCQFFPLIQGDVVLKYEKRSDAGLRMRLTAPEYPVHHGFIELTFAVLMVAIRRETERPELQPLEVCFAHRAPVDRRSFESLLGPHVRFDTQEHHMSLDRKTASLPLARKNSAVHKAAIRAACDLLRRS